MLLDRDREYEIDLPNEWPPIVYDEQTPPVESYPETTGTQVSRRSESETEAGATIMSNKVDMGVCNCVREPCECSIDPFPSATTPPPIVTVGHVYRRLQERTGSPEQTEKSKRTETEAQKSTTQTPEILGLPWYIVAGGAVVALLIFNDSKSGGK
jgi:hypothetical protein